MSDTFTYRLTIDTTLLDSEKYGDVLTALMDAVSEASRTLDAENVPHRIQLSDTSDVEPTLLDLDTLDHWPCPGCGRRIEPSDVRRHASECKKYDGKQGY